ncbi:MAG: hypothetical protein JXR94_09620 [Candidatus Hydrogenedentes bacterium]|nr:hypothetical protein [Candidatus Hydrogenedentota bacterium]
MGFWMGLWKWVFVATVGAFALLSLWVTVQGARDIFALMATLRGRHGQSDPGGG